MKGAATAPGPEHAAPAAPAKSARSNIVFAVTLLAGLAAAWFLRDLVLLIYASALFAALLMPIIQWIESRRMAGRGPSRGAAIAIALAGGLVAMAIVLGVMLPPIWREGNSLIASWPARTSQVLKSLHAHKLLKNFDFSSLQTYAADAGSWALMVAQETAATLASFFMVLMLTVYLVADGKQALDWSLSFFKPEARPRLAATLVRGQKRMRGWLFGQASLAAILFGSSTLVFGLLRLPDFFVLSLLAGLLNFVPILGPFAAAVIVTVVAGATAWPKMVAVLIFFAVYQAIEQSLLAPRIMKQAVDLPALAVIISLAIGAALAGVLGAVLAVPTAALAAELLNEYAVH